MSSESKSGGLDFTVQVKRCAAVVKGGRRFSFAALVVSGDGKGKVGCGYGKANEVPPAVEKATKQAMRNLVSVPLIHGTIPHTITAQSGCRSRHEIKNSGSDWLKPARPFFRCMKLVVCARFHARCASSNSATCSIGGRDTSTRHSSRKW